MAEKKKGLIKFITSQGTIITALIGLIGTILTVNYQFMENRRKSSDENFRSIVEELSSEDEAKRLAAASKIGTFIEKDFYLLKDKYHNDAVDILVNRTSVELDYNVLNAIMGALKKARKKDYNKIVEKLFDIERNFFIQEYAIKERKKSFDNALTQIENEYRKRENDYKKGKHELDRLYLNNLKVELKQREGDYFKNWSYENKLKMYKQVISDFLSVFLGGRDSSEQLAGC